MSLDCLISALARRLRLGGCWARGDRLRVYLRVERGGLWEGCRESRRCSRDTYTDSHITKYTSILNSDIDQK